MESLIFAIMIGLFIIGGIAWFIAIFEESCTAIIVSFITLVLGIILLCFQFYASYNVEQKPYERTEPYTTHEIIALSDGNEIDGKIRGSRYCMSGYINEKFTYVYGYQTYGGGMKIQKAGSDIAVVYFRDDIEPCAKWYKETRSFWWVTQERSTCDIYVPTDSLEASITIDLE